MKKSAYWLLAFSVAGVLLYFSMRGIEWREFRASLARAQVGTLLLACLISFLSYVLRSIRWRILLTVNRSISLLDVFCSNMAGYLGNNFLPARAGEVVRSTMVSSVSGAPVAEVLTTALAERLVDVIALLSWTPFVLLTIPNPPSWIAASAKPAAAVALVAVAGLVSTPFFGPWFERLILKLPLRESLKLRLVSLMEHVLTGVRTFHDPGRVARFVLLTAAIWSFDAVTFMLVARSMGLSLGLAPTLLLITGLGLGSSLPSTPGYVGIFQFVAVNVLPPFGISRNSALAYIILAQVAGYLVVLVLGLFGLWMFRRRRSARIDGQLP